MDADRLRTLWKNIPTGDGIDEPATADKVQGLTFTVDGVPETVTMSDADGRAVPLERRASAEGTLISVPWERLRYPH